MPSDRDVCMKVKKWVSETMDIRLVVGPDQFHTTHLSVKDTAELLRLLAIEWPAVYQDTSYKTDLGQRIGEAVYSWNEQWAEDVDQAYPKGWKWLGIAIYGYSAKDGEGEEAGLNWGVSLTDRTVFDVCLDSDAIDSRAYQACRKVYATVSEVLGLDLDE